MNYLEKDFPVSIPSDALIKSWREDLIALKRAAAILSVELSPFDQKIKELAQRQVISKQVKKRANTSDPILEMLKLIKKVQILEFNNADQTVFNSFKEDLIDIKGYGDLQSDWDNYQKQQDIDSNHAFGFQNYYIKDNQKYEEKPEWEQLEIAKLSLTHRHSELGFREARLKYSKLPNAHYSEGYYADQPWSVSCWPSNQLIGSVLSCLGFTRTDDQFNELYATAVVTDEPLDYTDLKILHSKETLPFYLKDHIVERYQNPIRKVILIRSLLPVLEGIEARIYFGGALGGSYDYIENRADIAECLFTYSRSLEGAIAMLRSVRSFQN